MKKTLHIDANLLRDARSRRSQAGQAVGSMIVLVDTSVWIRFLSNRAPYATELDRLLGRGEVSGHALVYGELLIGDKGGRQRLLAEYAPPAVISEVKGGDVYSTYTLRMRLVVACGLLVVAGTVATARQNRIDTVTPAAPELAAYGSLDVGVRTITATDRNRPDVLNLKEGAAMARADRTLTLEVWYPAALRPGQQPGGEYRTLTRDPALSVTLHGRAVRDAAPAAGAAFPLVIISHGYPGNRYLMSHLGENLASKGFVTVSIDHTDSTYDRQLAFASTLYNRPLDQLFVLNELDRLGRPGSGSFLGGLVDASRTGIIGYSMGGYGVLNVIGGGYSDTSVTGQNAPPNRLLAERAASNPAYRASIDRRVKAAIAIAPWGMPGGFWDRDGLSGITTPLLLVGGTADEVSGYEQGTRAIYLAAANADRYLLTFIHAGHNAAAPYPAPAEVVATAAGSRASPFAHYADPVWDTTRMNNILQHFATAFFGVHVKGEADKQAYLEVVPNGRDAVYAVDRDGKPSVTHTYWKGFKRGTAVGLVLEHARSAVARGVSGERTP